MSDLGSKWPGRIGTKYDKSESFYSQFSVRFWLCDLTFVVVNARQKKNRQRNKETDKQIDI